MAVDRVEEQAYFDEALVRREGYRESLGRVPEALSGRYGQEKARKYIEAVDLAPPDEPVAFGRIDRGGEKLYIGKNAIWDESNEVMVINWRLDAAAPYYKATPQDPLGLDAKLTYRCDKNEIQAIDELVFRSLEAAAMSGVPPTSDALLAALGATRNGELADIVQTIQAAQYDVITQDMEQLLVVQGGPGTGKTVIGLHRVSYLLYNRMDALKNQDVLVVGPNRGFIRYIASVLPSLGDVSVAQLAVTALGPAVRSGREEPAASRRIKGELRMIELLERGLANRRSLPTEDFKLGVAGRSITFPAATLQQVVNQRANAAHNDVYRDLREKMIDIASQASAGSSRLTQAPQDARGDAAREIDNFLERTWPNLTPQAFVLELLSTRRQLVAAAAGSFSDAEVEAIAIPPNTRIGDWEWSGDDVAVLDAASELLDGSPEKTYAYIVVDEAQDLSPLQIRAIKRRSRTGWMTILGDLAQATSPWAHDSWEEVAAHLGRPGVDLHVEELLFSYRLPMEVHQIAMRLMPHIVEGVDAPDAVRPSGHNPIIVPTEAGGLAGGVCDVIQRLLGRGLIGVVAPSSVLPSIEAALRELELVWSSELGPTSAQIVLQTAEQSKGLEFDNVIVVEPSGIVSETEHGLRALFIALTRCTSRLAIVHALPWPDELGSQDPFEVESAQVVWDEPEPITSAGLSGVASNMARAIAESVLMQIRESVKEELVPVVIQEMSRLAALDVGHRDV